MEFLELLRGTKYSFVDYERIYSKVATAIGIKELDQINYRDTVDVLVDMLPDDMKKMTFAAHKFVANDILFAFLYQSVSSIQMTDEYNRLLGRIILHDKFEINKGFTWLKQSERIVLLCLSKDSSLLNPKGYLPPVMDRKVLSIDGTSDLPISKWIIAGNYVNGLGEYLILEAKQEIFIEPDMEEGEFKDVLVFCYYRPFGERFEIGYNTSGQILETGATFMQGFTPMTLDEVPLYIMGGASLFFLQLNTGHF